MTILILKIFRLIFGITTAFNNGSRSTLPCLEETLTLFRGLALARSVQGAKATTHTLQGGGGEGASPRTGYTTDSPLPSGQAKVALCRGCTTV